MSLASFALALTLFWAAVHVIYHLHKPSKAQSLLPSPTRQLRRQNVWGRSTTQIVLNAFHLRIQTTVWNVPHDALTTLLKRTRGRSLTQVITRFYDFGTVLGVVGMIAALALLSITNGITALSLIRKLWVSPTSAPLSDGLNRLHLDRRTVGALVLETASSSHGSSWINPIIPGVTVPLAHLPVIFVAILVAQVMHELGHAITAALEEIPIHSAGVSITVIIPSAFVTFSTAALEALVPRARARIIAAGSFHNLLLWFLFASASHTGLGSLLWSIGYRDVSSLGRGVVEVDTNSPMHSYLHPGSLITKLDDYHLGSINSSEDTWMSYLKVRDFGHWERQPGLSCFTAVDTPSVRGCLDPSLILTSLSKKDRCNSTGDCTTPSTCVRPDKAEQLLRLTVERPFSGGDTYVILWSGPREEVWDEVKVGTLLPRSSFLPVWLPTSARMFSEYLVMGTLSLFFFNLLPLPYLDGVQLSETILEMFFNDTTEGTQDEYDLEAFGRLQEQRVNLRRQIWWKAWMGRLVPRITIGLLALWVLFEAINISV